MSVHSSEFDALSNPQNIKGYEEFSTSFTDRVDFSVNYEELWDNHHPKVNEQHFTYQVAQNLSQVASEFDGTRRKLMNLATQQLLELKIENRFWKHGHLQLRAWSDKLIVENKALREENFKLSLNYPGQYVPGMQVRCVKGIKVKGKTEIAVQKGSVGIVKSTKTSLLAKGRIAILFNERADGETGIINCLPEEIELEEFSLRNEMNKELQARVTLLNREKRELMQARDSWEAKCREVRKKSDIPLNEKEKLFNDREEKFNKKIAYFNTIIEGKNGRIETLSKKLESSDVNEYEKEIKELKIELHQAKETISSSEKCVKKLKNQIQNKVQQIEAQGSKIKKMKESHHQREEEVKHSKKKETSKWKKKYKKLKEDMGRATSRLHLKGSQCEEILRAVLEDLEVEQSKVQDIQKVLQNNLEKVRKELKDEESNFKCVACLDETPCGIYMPCRHAVFCEDCLDQVPPGAPCPLCRSQPVECIAFANKPK